MITGWSLADWLVSSMIMNEWMPYHTKFMRFNYTHCIWAGYKNTSCNTRPPDGANRCLWRLHSHAYGVRPPSVLLGTYGVSVLMPTSLAPSLSPMWTDFLNSFTILNHKNLRELSRPECIINLAIKCWFSKRYNILTAKLSSYYFTYLLFN